MGQNKWERIKRKRKRERFSERREENPSLRKQNFLKNGMELIGRKEKEKEKERKIPRNISKEEKFPNKWDGINRKERLKRKRKTERFLKIF